MPCWVGIILGQAEIFLFVAGAFLMDDLPLVERIVKTCAQGLDVPVTVKIRVFPEVEKTIAYAQMLERAGASLIAVHGRLREQKKSNGADANWDVIKVSCLALAENTFAAGCIVWSPISVLQSAAGYTLSHMISLRHNYIQNIP